MTIEPMTRSRLERNEILRTLDVVRARALLPRAVSDAAILMGLHKARYECTDIERELRFYSRTWLAERGLARMDGRELLPPDFLPGDAPGREDLYYSLKQMRASIKVRQ